MSLELSKICASRDDYFFPTETEPEARAQWITGVTGRAGRGRKEYEHSLSEIFVILSV